MIQVMHNLFRRHFWVIGLALFGLAVFLGLKVAARGIESLTGDPRPAILR